MIVDRFASSTIEAILKFRMAAERFVGPALPWLEFFAFVLSLLFIAGIIYSIVRSSWLVYKMDEWIDVLNAGDLSKRRILRGWKQICERLLSPNPTDWKLAILEADKMLGDILRLAGFAGSTVHERLDKVPPTVLSVVAELRAVHRLRDRLAHEPDFALTQEEVARAVEIYKRAFQELNLID